MSTARKPDDLPDDEKLKSVIAALRPLAEGQGRAAEYDTLVGHMSRAFNSHKGRNRIESVLAIADLLAHGQPLRVAMEGGSDALETYVEHTADADMLASLTFDLESASAALAVLAKLTSGAIVNHVRQMGEKGNGN